MTAEENGTWIRAYALALHGITVTFHGGYGTVAVEHNSDGSYTADVRPSAGGTDIRVFPAGADTVQVAAECSSIAAHGPGAPTCSSGDTGMCGHITLVTDSPPRTRAQDHK
jgi:hypothetical protein